MNEDFGIVGVFICIFVSGFMIGSATVGIQNDKWHVDQVCRIIATDTQSYLECKSKNWSEVYKYIHGEYKKVGTNEQQ